VLNNTITTPTTKITDFDLEFSEEEIIIHVKSSFLDMFSPTPIKNRILEQLKPSTQKIIFDLHKVTYISSSFISMIFILYRDYPDLQIVLHTNHALEKFFYSIGKNSNYLLHSIQLIFDTYQK